MAKQDEGLLPKFVVYRRNGEHLDWAFVLADDDPFTPTALHAYATACKAEYPALAQDLFKQALLLRTRQQEVKRNGNG